MKLQSDYLIGEYPKVFKVIIDPSWSCEQCQEVVLESQVFLFDGKRFCSYRCSWRFLRDFLVREYPEQIGVIGESIDLADKTLLELISLNYTFLVVCAMYKKIGGNKK